MESKPLVSVIMGIYNCADTLDEAIESILAQTYDNWQIIMCDDASTDSTYLVAQKYIEKYPEKFVLLKNEKNLGLNATLNKCLKYAKGEYIARMDGDDISLPDRLKKEVDFLNINKEYAIVSTQMGYFDKNGMFGQSHDNIKPRLKDMVKGTPHCHAPCMVRKKAYLDVDGYSVEKNLLRVEDYDLWIKMYTKGYRGYNLPEVLYMMRDDRNATKRRKYRYRINEAYVRYKAVKELKLPIYNVIYCLRPLILGLVPAGIYEVLHKKRLR